MKSILPRSDQINEVRTARADKVALTGNSHSGFKGLSYFNSSGVAGQRPLG
jgi:hypothetical protein